MKTLKVDIPDRSYEIRIGQQWDFGEAVTSLKGRKALIVADSTVDAMYGDRLQAELAGFGIICFRLVLEPGEPTKCMQCLELIYNGALDAGLDRKGVIFALGGGVIGDLAGFAAATYMRGIGYVQVPTTLLAMVDSSVGGKTAINLDRGKNLVGSFHQPLEVTAAVSTLTTLPSREFSAGMAEVIKHAVIWDAEFLGRIERDIPRIMAREPEILTDIILRCCDIKSDVVAVDEREAGVRGILNFGHTLAHSLETVFGYGGLLHGEAVSVGMVYALRLSVLARGLSPSDEERVTNLLKAASLPVYVSDLGRRPAWDEVRKLMESDKKSVSGSPRFVLAVSMGSVAYGCELPEEQLKGAYDSLLEEGGV